MKNTKRTGYLGEDIACQELAKAGYAVVERNWFCTNGEIDIIAIQDDTWAFVEVKARHGHRNGRPEEAVTPSKLLRIEKAAETYLIEHKLPDVSWRIDVVAIELDRSNHVTSMRILQGLTSDEY